MSLTMPRTGERKVSRLTESERPMSTDDRAILVDSRRLRLFTLFILYVAQGVPIGLFWFAIPTWMATNGADAADVGYVLGLTALPWTLKLVNGFIMDRYTWLAMGRRRVWIVGAQMTMIVLLIGAAALAPQASDIVLLGMAGFLVNMATTFQDVAVDGLAVDIMEEDERARDGERRPADRRVLDGLRRVVDRREPADRVAEREERGQHAGRAAASGPTASRRPASSR